MKTFILSIIVTMITSVAGAQQKSFYDFTVKTIDGKYGAQNETYIED